MALAALAIFLLAIAAFPQTAFAGTSNGKKDAAPGQVRKDGPADENQANDTPSAGTPTAADHPEDYSTHDQTNGPGGQVCDGDPDNAPGAGGNYENTCDAGPSQNGAGDGNATGKPCAGCVGNADDKNPKGQATSGPTDENNGYECDQKGRSANEGNNGIGYGNPAHTGCQDTPPPPEKCPDGSDMPASGTCTCPDGSTMPTSGKCDTDKCPDGSNMPANGKCDTDKCPDGSNMPANGKCDTDKCPDGSNMPANGKCTCPDGSTMPASGTCTPPRCVPSSTNACGQQTPSCVASASENRCGGGTAVLGETLGRPVEVLGVQLTAAPEAAVAPAGLARTGSELLGFARFGVLLALAGLALTLTARRRRASVTAE
jgi:hypothetical protein